MRVNDIYDIPPGTWWRSQTPRIEPYNVYWPIPQSVITANTLGSINQNVGYVGAENNVPHLKPLKNNIVM